ncbi:hypothetical protein N657DRAFT_584570, partial [Parathielavia appendiculata]
RLLLDNGADVNAQGGQYGTALQAAASKGEMEIVRLLLDNGADVNAQGGEYGTALQAAASKERRILCDCFLTLARMSTLKEAKEAGMALLSRPPHREGRWRSCDCFLTMVWISTLKEVNMGLLSRPPH